jgi:putative transposase
MSRRTHVFAEYEYYHCYNRGTDKRRIFMSKKDQDYFIKSLFLYNTITPKQKLRLYSEDTSNDEPLVEIEAFCLLPNHYHIVLREISESGISKLMQRLSIGYTMYFNARHKRNGVLFQGPFKSKHIETDQDLRTVTGYVFYNNIIHEISNPTQYRNYINSDSSVRDPYSNFQDLKHFREVAEIIKLQRLTFD